MRGLEAETERALGWVGLKSQFGHNKAQKVNGEFGIFFKKRAPISTNIEQRDVDHALRHYSNGVGGSGEDKNGQNDVEQIKKTEFSRAHEITVPF